MSFLHPEFLFWLLPLSALLFYFWLTQKPLHHRWLRPETLERLRAPETTMGLKGRNALFMVASFLIIMAMAQPVILNPTPMESEKLHVVMVIEQGDHELFEKNRSLALSTLYTLLGENIELIALDDALYSISPRSNDGAILAELIKNLKPSSTRPNFKDLEERLKQIRGADMWVVITSEPLVSDFFLRVSSSDEIEKVHEKLLKLRTSNRLQAHIPLFFYPLGLAMILILLALSSMSKRQSIGVGSLLVLFIVQPFPSAAGILDFRNLAEATKAYESGEYQKSEKLFADYQRIHDSPQVRYNRANALYMSGNYEKARYWYRKVYTDDPILKAHTEKNLKQSEEKIEAKKREKCRANRGEKGQKNRTLASASPRKSIRFTHLFRY